MDSVISVLETFTKQQKHVFLLMEKLLRNNALKQENIFRTDFKSTWTTSYLCNELRFLSCVLYF